MAKRMIAAGKIEPRRRAVCGLGVHYGKPLRAEDYEAAGGIWSETRDCSACGSSVQLHSFVQVAA